MPSDLPAAREDLKAMEDLAKMVNDHPPQRAISLSAITVALDIILQQLRKDILGTLSNERKRLKQEDDAETCLLKLENAELKFDHQSLQDALKYDDGLYCVGENGRKPPSTLAWILSTLFGDLNQDGVAKAARKFFHKKPFRELAWKAQDLARRAILCNLTTRHLFTTIAPQVPSPTTTSKASSAPNTCASTVSFPTSPKAKGASQQSKTARSAPGSP